MKNITANTDLSGAGTSTQNSIAMSMDCQEADMWCWAAVAQAVEVFGGKVVSQSAVATDHVSTSQPGVICSSSDAVSAASLCGNPCLGGCNSAHILSKVLIERGIKVSALRKTPDFVDIVQAIDAGKPLPVRIQIETGTGGGHFICVVGYADDGEGNQFVELLDPLVPGVGMGAASLQNVPFRAFVGGQYDVNGEQGTPNFIYELK